jgi:hypothetical protein
MDAARVVLAIAMTAAGCAADEETSSVEVPASCGDPAAYSPFPPGGEYVAGPAAVYTWPGEAFDGYGPPWPRRVECASGKSAQPHLDVTAGCLDAVGVSDGRYRRGRIAGATFRAVALGEADGARVKWTEQAVEYRFHFAGPSGGGAQPGFKAFVRYRTEDDLYVASWRLDGVVQIQRKWCGVYTPLAVIAGFGAPSPGAWHRIRFSADGDQLALELDGEPVLQATSATFSWGTAGIRTDGVDGAYIEEWRVE